MAETISTDPDTSIYIFRFFRNASFFCFFPNEDEVTEVLDKQREEEARMTVSQAHGGWGSR